MSEDLIWANMMCRDEPLAPYSILSIIDHVDKVLVTDTGSTDGTVEDLLKLQQMYPHKIILNSVEIDICQMWFLDKQGVHPNGANPQACKELGDIRRQQHANSKSRFIILLDADEIHLPEGVKRWKKKVFFDLSGYNALALPFIDWIYEIGVVRQKHHMCRIFRREVTEIKGDFLAEMHYHKEKNICYDRWDRSGNTDFYDSDKAEEHVWHFECLIKPWRKEKKVIGKVNYILPKVILDNLETFPRLKLYLEEWTK